MYSVYADNHDIITVRVYDVDVESKNDSAVVEVCDQAGKLLSNLAMQRSHINHSILCRKTGPL